MTVTILKGDCRDVLATLPDESVHCVVTSPPYWGLRDYGVDGQIGIESSYGDYVETIVDVLGQAWRVLRADGTVWLNLGDSYFNLRTGDRGGMPGQTVHNGDERGKPARPNRGNDGAERLNGCARRANKQVGLKEKDLVGIPWRVALALQADGWWLRQDIIWSKPNPMPESIKDRCTKAHEYIFLLSKSGRYYYDQDAIAEEAVYAGLTGQDDSGFKDPKQYNGKHGRATKGYTASAYSNPQSAQRGSRSNFGDTDTRNKRSVWDVPTAPFPDAHFATFPPALVEPCILAGCPKGGTVLDPFGGAGTTGLVADRLERNAILIELNPEYAAMAERRIKGDAGMFADVKT